MEEVIEDLKDKNLEQYYKKLKNADETNKERLRLVKKEMRSRKLL